MPFQLKWQRTSEACPGTIAKDSLRMARMVHDPDFDAKIYHWPIMSLICSVEIVPCKVTWNSKDGWTTGVALM